LILLCVRWSRLKKIINECCVRVWCGAAMVLRQWKVLIVYLVQAWKQRIFLDFCQVEENGLEGRCCGWLISAHFKLACSKNYLLYCRGRQSPACEFHPSGPWGCGGSSVLTLNSAHKTYRTMSDCFHAERDLVAHWYSQRWSALLHSLTRWCWLTPFTLDPSVTSLVKLGHFGEVGKIVQIWKLVELILKQSWTKYQKSPHFPLSAFADMTWHNDKGDGLVHSYFFSRKIYLSGPQQVPWGLIQPSTPKILPTPALLTTYNTVLFILAVSTRPPARINYRTSHSNSLGPRGPL